MSQISHGNVAKKYRTELIGKNVNIKQSYRTQGKRKKSRCEANQVKLKQLQQHKSKNGNVTAGNHLFLIRDSNALSCQACA